MATLDDVAVGRKARRKLTGYWLILPGAVWLALFFVVPFFSLLSASLYYPNGSVLTGYSMTWHFQNFADAFAEHRATLWRSLWFAAVATGASYAGDADPYRHDDDDTDEEADADADDAAAEAADGVGALGDDATDRA